MLSVDIVSVVIRAGSFIALFQAAGIALFMMMFGRLMSASLSPIQRIGRASAWLAVVLVAIHQLLTAARMTGDYAGLLDMSMHWRGLQAHAGIANGVRIAGLVLIAIALPRGSVVWRTVGVAGAVLALMSFLMTGHTSVSEHRWLLAPWLLLHLAVVAFWFGSLLPLYVAAGEETMPAAARLIAAFSAVATWWVPGLGIAGVTMAYVLLPGLRALVTPYGLLLLCKVTGFALLLGLAAFNKWRLGPAMIDGDRRDARRFRRSVMIEYVLICVVLTATAIMTSLFSPEP